MNDVAYLCLIDRGVSPHPELSTSSVPHLESDYLRYKHKSQCHPINKASLTLY